VEIDKSISLDKNTMDDIHFAISQSSYGQDKPCVFSDYMDNLIFRLRLNSNVFNKTKKRGGGVAGSDRRDLSVEEFSGHVAKQYRIARQRAFQTCPPEKSRTP
jgi:hypothetical protein